MSSNRNLAIRFAIYSLCLVYIGADLYLFKGPLRRALDSMNPQSDVAVEKRREAKVVAIVYGEGITLAELDVRVLQHLRRKGRSVNQRTPERLYEMRLVVLQELILERVLRGKLRARPEHAVFPEDVQLELDGVRDQFSSNREFLKVMGAAGMDDGALRNRYSEWLGQRAYVERLVKGNRDRMPMDDHIQSFYDSNVDQFTLPERYHVRHIFLTTLGKKPEVVGERMAEAHLKIASGQVSFDSVVSELSEDPSTKDTGGDLGWLSVDRLPSGLSPEHFSSLAPGQMSVPIQSRIGWHIFDVVESRPARQLELVEVEPMIRDYLSHRQHLKYSSAVKRVLENDAEAAIDYDMLHAPFSFPDRADDYAAGDL